MSNVKETYESAFGPEGYQFTNYVTRTLYSIDYPERARIRDANSSTGRGQEFLIANFMIGKDRIRLKFGYE